MVAKTVLTLAAVRKHKKGTQRLPAFDAAEGGSEHFQARIALDKRAGPRKNVVARIPHQRLPSAIAAGFEGAAGECRCVPE